MEKTDWRLEKNEKSEKRNGDECGVCHSVDHVGHSLPCPPFVPPLSFFLLTIFVVFQFLFIYFCVNYQHRDLYWYCCLFTLV